MQQLTNEQLQQAYRYAMSLTNNHDEAMDIVHSTYASILERGRKDVHNQQGYFFQSIRNRFIDRRRYDCRWSFVEEEVQDNLVDIHVNVLEALMIHQDLLKKLWKEFKPLERELLYLWAIEEYTIDEISELTETPRGTLLSRIHRIRKKIVVQDLKSEVFYENTY